MAESWNVGRTGWNFQCRVRLINGLFCKELQWQQMAAEPLTVGANNKKATSQQKGRRGRPFVIPICRVAKLSTSQ
jgi:hypothetical protein